MYLDNAATTKMHPEVFRAMQEVSFANYNAKYYEEAKLAKKQVDAATRDITEALHIKTESIVYTSGATESNNYIIKAMFELYPDRHFITSTIEHKCVLESFRYIESKGANVTYVGPNQNCEITVDSIQKEMTTDTILVSVMHVNNETGVINDIKAIQKMCRTKDTFFHSDAVQALGKVTFDYSYIDFISFSGHKINGPKGIGLLINNSGKKLPSLIHGSEQQNGNRAGTLPNELIIGISKAIQLILKTDNNKLLASREWVIDMFKENFGDDFIINFQSNTVDSILSIRLAGEVNQIFLDENKETIKASTGSSCSINNPSYVLKECNLTDTQIRETIRLSFSKYDDMIRT